MDLHLADTAAVVSASSSGLGKASAKALAREGADVVINGRDEDRLAAAVDEVELSAKGRVVGQSGDITDPAAIETLVDRAMDEFGRLDHLVTSAGGPTPYRFPETDEDDWYGAFDLLVMSVVRLVHEAAPHLQQDGGGAIVNITSTSVKEATQTNVLSSSVRMAVIGLEKTLSMELAPAVRANAILPGPYETPRIREILDDAVARGEYEDYDEAAAAWAADIPVERLGDPMELGDAVAFLCSDRASYLNGQAIPINGGLTASTY